MLTYGKFEEYSKAETNSLTQPKFRQEQVTDYSAVYHGYTFGYKMTDTCGQALCPKGYRSAYAVTVGQDRKIQIWQERLTPIQKIIADGCHLNRRIEALVKQQFLDLTIKKFYDPQLPKVIGYMYQGVAVK